jgi:adenylate kinase
MKYVPNPEYIKVIKNWLGTGAINIFGPQFSGKDTQGNMLVKAFGAAPLLGGGDILRNSTIPKHSKQIMERGELFPTQDYIDIVLPYLSRPEFTGKPLILSAVGRWFGEEKGVLKVTAQSNHPLKAVIYLTLNEELIWKRWQNHKNLSNRGMRRDDAKESLEMRLKEFREKTLPVVDFYRNKGILIEINADQTPEKVFSDIINGLLPFAQA